MPRNEQGKNKKWSKHRERDTGEDQFADLSERAAMQGKDLWDLREEELERVRSQAAQEEAKDEAPAGEEGEEEVVAGHQGLMEVENPNRRNPLVVQSTDKISKKHKEAVDDQRRQDREDRQMRTGATAQAKQDLERLAEIKAKREAAAREREDKRTQSEKLKADAQNSFKKSS
jgi:hypothetical protein